MARSIDEKRRLLTEVKGLLGAGATEGEQLDALSPWDVGAYELRNLRNEVLNEHTENLRHETPEGLYIRYALRQEKCVSELDQVITACFDRDTDKGIPGGVLSAAVQAVKAKSHIIDATLERGQSLGVVHKAPSKSVRIGGVVVANASIGDLQKLVEKHTKALQKLARTFAPVNYLEAPSAEIYHDPPGTVEAEAPKPPKRKKVLA